MKANNTLPSLGALAFSAFFAASPAQACMPFFSSSTGPDACPSVQAQAQPRVQPRACPQPGQTEHQGQACGLINPELMAVLGDMAAGGMQVATHMMRVLAEEVGRYAALSEDVK